MKGERGDHENPLHREVSAANRDLLRPSHSQFDKTGIVPVCDREVIRKTMENAVVSYLHRCIATYYETGCFLLANGTHQSKPISAWRSAQLLKETENPIRARISIGARGDARVVPAAGSIKLVRFTPLQIERSVLPFQRGVDGYSPLFADV